MPDPLAARVRSTPDGTALVDAKTGEAWPYGELDDAVSGLAGNLAGLGLEPGDHVGLLADTSVGAVRVVHAAWRLGLRLVPLNVGLADPELERRADRCDLDALVCDASSVDAGRAAVDCPVASIGSAGEDGAATGERAEGVPVVGALSDVNAAPVEPATWTADDPALLPFTSGTTGEPKAVTLTMGNLLASAAASAFRLGVLPTDRWLLCLPIYHVGGLAPVFRSALYGTALVVRPGEGGFDAAAVARSTHDHDVTGLSLVPTQLRRVLDAGADAADRAGLARSVRTVLLGGAPASRGLIERCERNDVPVHPTYGLTETASQVATATPEKAFVRPDTVGQPLLGTTVTVVDEACQPLPAGEPGEIVVSGPTVTPGYYDGAAATEAAFCEHGLRTSDVGRVDDAGRLFVTGRLDDRIITGGESVLPSSVASVLLDDPAVEDAAVVGLDDPEWGERVAALVVPRYSDEVDRDHLLDHCRERLAAFEVPKTVAFAEELPRTPSGTVDREAVRRRLSGSR